MATSSPAFRFEGMRHLKGAGMSLSFQSFSRTASEAVLL